MLDRVVRACLAKDPADRIQSAHDVAMDLRWVGESALRESEEPPAEFKKSWAVWAAAVLVAFIALAGFAGYRWAKSSANSISLHAQIPPPDKFSLDTTGDAGGMPVLSPQGDKLAFVAHSGEAKMLWVRALNADTAQRLEGTQNAMHPFWSPDGGYIGFFANGKLAKIAATGGPVTVLADAPNSRGGSWSADDVIVFAPDFLGGLSKVSGQGGTVEPATLIEKTKHDTHAGPGFCPMANTFFFSPLATLEAIPRPTESTTARWTIKRLASSSPATPQRNTLPGICSIALIPLWSLNRLIQNQARSRDLPFHSLIIFAMTLGCGAVSSRYHRTD